MRMLFKFSVFALLCYITSVAAQTSSGPSSGAVIGSKYPVHNLTQKVDHSSNSSTTFNQRYQLVTDYFKPGGPILFVQGPETSLVPIENHDFIDWMEELGAIVAVLEHRFFGTSTPAEFDGTTASYAPLTLDNVMKDAVAFINFIQKNITGAANSKTIVGGGSYGGNLALTYRVKHPETFFGSFASAPMTESFGPLVNNTAKFRSAEQHQLITGKLSNIYHDASAEAAAKIKAAMMELYTCALIGSRLTHALGNNCTEAIPDLNFCGTAPNATQLDALYATALSAYRYIPQFNYPFATTYAMAYPFQYLINATLAASTPAEVLRIPWAMTNWQASLSSCIDWSSSNITGQLDVGVSNSYFYLQCQYYPISESVVPEGNLLPPSSASTPAKVCANPEYESSIYNQTNEFFQEYLGTATHIIDSTTRLIILQGGYDRVAGVGMPDLTLSDDREHSRVVFTAGIGHAEDSYPTSFIPLGTRPQLDEVRTMKLEYVKEWLGWYNSTNVWNATSI
ncbi:Lysosomal Pro-X carboxypeptidase [Lachnellula willkommii]|uniref:Lysosomal Pro-X carboxypeptidase n=1 Tax=Lachnellula willkommii TaxID=215461 RepID=A0A559MIC4_9HELO|nr:Lysosomal Pro-X carboxypeptidase [Lachnellula willkommii]